MHYISYRHDTFISEEQIGLHHTFIISLHIYLQKVDRIFKYRYLRLNSNVANLCSMKLFDESRSIFFPVLCTIGFTLARVRF
jgi:enamine deaminase RidA (YjgF/YER057c/UK114 family)